jgi:hypothetical protein
MVPAWVVVPLVFGRRIPYYMLQFRTTKRGKVWIRYETPGVSKALCELYDNKKSDVSLSLAVVLKLLRKYERFG